MPAMGARICVRAGLGGMGGGLAVRVLVVILPGAVCFFLWSLSSSAAMRSALNCWRGRFGFAWGRGNVRNASGGSAKANIFGDLGISTDFFGAFGMGMTTAAGFSFGAGGVGFSAFGSGMTTAAGFSFGAGGVGFSAFGSGSFCVTVFSATVTSSTMTGCSITTGESSKSGSPYMATTITPACNRVDMAMPLRKARHRYFAARAAFAGRGTSVTKATFLKPAALRLPITAITAP